MKGKRGLIMTLFGLMKSNGNSNKHQRGCYTFHDEGSGWFSSNRARFANYGSGDMFCVTN